MEKKASIFMAFYMLLLATLVSGIQPKSVAAAVSIGNVKSNTIIVNATNTLEYVNGTFILDEPIRLEDNATLLIRNARVYFESASRTIIEAYDNATVILEEARLFHTAGYSYMYLYENATATITDSRLLNVYLRLWGYSKATIADSILTYSTTLYDFSKLSVIGSKLESASCYGSSFLSLKESLTGNLRIYDRSAASVVGSTITYVVYLEFEQDSEVSLSALPTGAVDTWRLYEDNIVTNAYVDLNITESTVNEWQIEISGTSNVSLENSKTLSGVNAYSASNVLLLNSNARSLGVYDSSNVTIRDSNVTSQVYLEFEQDTNVTTALTTGAISYWDLQENSTVAESYINLHIENGQVAGWYITAYETSQVSLEKSALRYIYAYQNAMILLKGSTFSYVYAYANSVVSITDSSGDGLYCYGYNNAAVSNSTLKYCGVYGYSNITMNDSAVEYRFNVGFYSDTEAKVSLPSGLIDYWNLYQNNTVTRAYVNITITNSELNEWGVDVQDTSSVSIEDSATLDSVNAYSMSNVSLYNSIAERLGVYYSSNVTLKDSSVTNQLTISFEQDTNLTLTELKKGAVDYWDLHENGTVTKSYLDLHIENSEVENYQIYVYGTSHVSLRESELSYVYYYGDSIGSVSSSSLYGIYAYYNSQVTLSDSTINYVLVYDYANMTIKDSVISYEIGLEFEYDSEAELALPTGTLDHWNLYQDNAVAKAYIDLTLQNSQMNGKWTMYSRSVSKLLTHDSSLNYVYTYDFSDVVISDCSFYSAYLYGFSTANITDSEVQSYLRAYDYSWLEVFNTQAYRVRGYSQSSIRLINCSVSYELSAYDNSEIFVGWHLTVRTVNACDDPVAEARVQVNWSDGERMYDLLTDTNGKVRVNLWEKLVYSTGVETYGNYTLAVTKGEYTNQTLIELVHENIVLEFRILVDTDGDGLYDCEEELAGTDINNIDTEEDGLTDYEEVHIYHTNPLNADTDGDGVSDKEEIEMGTNPLVETTSAQTIAELRDQIAFNTKLLYVTIATTAVFLITTIYLAIKRKTK